MTSREIMQIIDFELDNWARWANAGEMYDKLRVQPQSIFKYLSKPDSSLPVDEQRAILADRCVSEIPAHRAERVAITLRYRFQRETPMEEIARAIGCEQREFGLLLRDGQKWFWRLWQNQQRAA